jgi:quercetin dioxygenase-like cupin family protein
MYDALKEVAFSPERPLSRLLVDSPEMRIVVFGLEPGQEIPPHTAPSRVMMFLLRGKGTFTTAKGNEPASPGALAVTEPNEPHGLKAVEQCVMLAVIAPRP